MSTSVTDATPDVSNVSEPAPSPLIRLKEVLPIAVAFNLGLYIRGKRPAFQIDFQEHGVYQEGGMNPKSFEYMVRSLLREIDPDLEKRTSIFGTRTGQVVCDRGDQPGSLCALMNDACKKRPGPDAFSAAAISAGEECSRGVGKLLGLKCSHDDWRAFGKNFRVYFEVYDNLRDVPKRVGEKNFIPFRSDNDGPRSSSNPIFMAQMCTSGEHIRELFDQIEGFAGVAREMELMLMRMEIDLHPDTVLNSTANRS